MFTLPPISSLKSSFHDPRRLRLLSLTHVPSMESTSPKPNYDFSVRVPHRRPRPWERVPKCSFAPRHRGRKVWKRYELRSKEREGTRHSQINRGKALENLAGDVSPARPVKRLRNVPREEGADAVALGYTATLRSEGPGTPKRGFDFLLHTI